MHTGPLILDIFLYLCRLVDAQYSLVHAAHTPHAFRSTLNNPALACCAMHVQYGLVHISAGDLLREQVALGSPAGDDWPRGEGGKAWGAGGGVGGFGQGDSGGGLEYPQR